jgi:FtsP/CotA-like multicopper oxidase with cupredoxin domain
MDRRSFLKTAAAAGALPWAWRAQAAPLRLEAGAASVPLVGDEGPATVANARTFAPRFGATVRPWLIALDGHPVAPRPLEGSVLLGAGMRADLILDMTGAPGAIDPVTDHAYQQPYELMRFVYGAEAALRAAPPVAPAALAPNPVPEPDLARAERHRVVFEGGAMGGLSGAHMGGRFRSMRDLAEAGKLWAINGQVPEDMSFSPRRTRRRSTRPG